MRSSPGSGAWRTALAALALFACSDRPADPTASPPEEGRDRARVVRLALAVDALDDAVGSLRGLVATHAGHVRWSSSREASASFVARVPAARLDAFRGGARELGQVLYEEEIAEDVTEARADVRARLRNARVEEERLRELLAERAASLADVIAVEARLSDARGRIERLEAEERALGERVDLAEVQIDLSVREPPFWRDPLAATARAGALGLEIAAAALVGVASVAVALGPTAALALTALGLLVWLVRTIARRRARA